MTTQRNANEPAMTFWNRLRHAALAALTTALLVTSGAAQAARSEVVYFHNDALGSPTAAFSETGAVCWYESYTPYGDKYANEDSTTPDVGCGLLGTDVGYTGHVQDTSGLVYAQQRYYDPVVGRFLSVDPVLPGASDPKFFGRYQYAFNSPYRYTDPTGTIPDNWASSEDETFACSACGRTSESNPNGAYRGNHVIESRYRTEQLIEKVSGFGPAGIGSIRLAGRAQGLLGKLKSFFSRMKGTYAAPSLTPAQQARVRQIENIIKYNALPHDFAGAAKELKGIKTGYDHVTEMRQSVVGLKRALNGLRGSLQNPNLDDVTRTVIELSVARGQATLSRMENTLNGG